MKPYWIRELRGSDVECLSDIALMSLDEVILPEVFLSFYQIWPEGQFVSSDFAGTPNGFLCSVPTEDGGARIMAFAVHPSWRRNGIGEALLDCAINRAKSTLKRYITLEVKHTNLQALEFYEKHGFKETAILSRYYRDGSDASKMVLFL